MKRILTFWLLSAFIALGANLPIGNVSVRTNGVLVWPTNFFSTNRVLIQAVITNTGSGSGTNTSLTNLVDVRVNTPGLADGNVLKWVAAHGFWTNATDEGGATGFQPASGNLTNWSTLATNQVVWTNALLALTNQLAHTNLAKFYSTNGIMVTNTDGTITVTRSGNGNQMIYTVAINPGGGGILNQPASENLTNWSNVTTNQVVWTNALVGLTNGFVTWGTTNTLLPTNYLATIFGITNYLAPTNVYATTSWVGNTFAPTGVVNTLIANATNYLANTNGNFMFSGPVFSSASSTNSPAYNELVVADWVRTLLSSGYHIYTGTNIDAIATSGNGGTNVYQFQSDITYRNSRNYTNPAVNEYVGTVISTNKVMTLAGPIDVSIYLNISGGGAAMSVHPEIYYTYDKTNLFGDFVSQSQAIGTATNLYQWVVTFPTVTATNSDGFYIVRKLKVDSSAGAAPVLTVSVGTNTPSHISYSSAGVSGDYVTWGTTNTLVATNALVGLTNGFVTWGTTNTLVATNALVNLTNNFATWTTTNTLVATSALVNLTNNFVTWTTTNTLIATSYLSTIFGITNQLAHTNVYATTNWVGNTFLNTNVANTLIANATNFLVNTNALVALTNGFVTWGTTNTLAPTNVNSSTLNGLVKTGSGQNAKVWKTDASGNPDWRDDATGAAGTAINVATNDVTVGDNTNITFWAGTNVTIQGTNRSGFTDITINSSGGGSSPTTTDGDMIFRTNGADASLPIGFIGDTLIVNSSLFPTWKNDSFDNIRDSLLNFSSALTFSGGSYAGLNGMLALVIPPASVPSALRMSTYATNGIGGTAYSRLYYNNGTSINYLNHTWAFETSILFNNANTNVSFQCGSISSGTSSNQTAGNFFEFNFAVGPSIKARTIGTASDEFDTGIEPALNTWYFLGFAGTTNTMIFYTNRVPCWTNSDNTTIGRQGIIGCVLTNCRTNPAGGAVANYIYVDHFTFIRY